MHPDLFERLLQQGNYDPVETRFIIDGFRNGFDIGYPGLQVRQSKSNNLPFYVWKQSYIVGEDSKGDFTGQSCWTFCGYIL